MERSVRAAWSLRGSPIERLIAKLEKPKSPHLFWPDGLSDIEPIQLAFLFAKPNRNATWRCGLPTESTKSHDTFNHQCLMEANMLLLGNVCQTIASMRCLRYPKRQGSKVILGSNILRAMAVPPISPARSHAETHPDQTMREVQKSTRGRWSAFSRSAHMGAARHNADAILGSGIRRELVAISIRVLTDIRRASSFHVGWCFSKSNSCFGYH